MLTRRGTIGAGELAVDRDVLKAEIAARLDRLLDENEKSGAAIAKEFGRTRQWLSNLRNGTNMVQTKDIPDLVRILGCSANYLLGLTEGPLEPSPAVAEPAVAYAAAAPEPEPVTWHCPCCGAALVTTRAEN
jgi:transcriptional regulator with XRE-family HTH domain